MKLLKVMGFDGIFVWLLKDVVFEVFELIIYIINLIIFMSIILFEWKIVMVILIYKFGDKSDLNNYCLILVFFLIFKVMEWVI